MNLRLKRARMALRRDRSGLRRSTVSGRLWKLRDVRIRLLPRAHVRTGHSWVKKRIRPYADSLDRSYVFRPAYRWLRGRHSKSDANGCAEPALLRHRARPSFQCSRPQSLATFACLPCSPPCPAAQSWSCAYLHSWPSSPPRRSPLPPIGPPTAVTWYASTWACLWT